jgi:prepilin signal peptidase PulO-like enzyme (type II secretory pathway)
MTFAIETLSHMFKSFISNYGLSFLGLIIGAIAGYFYWQQVGCASGTCAITSKPLNSTLYGALMGYLLVGIFKKDKKTVVSNKQDQF